jgi:hypothetical protein
MRKGAGIGRVMDPSSELESNNIIKEIILEEEFEFNDFPEVDLPEPSTVDLDKIEYTGEDVDWEWNEDQITFDDEPYEL